MAACTGAHRADERTVIPDGVASGGPFGSCSQRPTLLAPRHPRLQPAFALVARATGDSGRCGRSRCSTHPVAGRWGGGRRRGRTAAEEVPETPPAAPRPLRGAEPSSGVVQCESTQHPLDLPEGS